MVRAAASSMASGRPSRRRQISATAGARGVEALVRVHRRGPLDEQPDGVASPTAGSSARQGQATDRPHDLAVMPSALPTRAEHPQRGTRASRSPTRRATAVDEVLAVVDEQQRIGPAEAVDDQPAERVLWVLRHAEHLRHRGVDQLGLGHRPQLHQPHPVRPDRELTGGHLHRQPALPGASHPGQGDQPRRGQQGVEFRELVVAPDEAGELHRQVVCGQRRSRRRRRSGRQQRRVLAQDRVAQGAQLDARGPGRARRADGARPPGRRREHRPGARCGRAPPSAGPRSPSRSGLSATSRSSSPTTSTVPPHGELGVQADLVGLHPDAVQTGDLRLREDRSARSASGSPRHSSSAARRVETAVPRLTPGERPSTVGGELLEPVDVERTPVDPQRVARTAGDDLTHQAGRPQQRPTQLADQHVQHLTGARRLALTPQGLHQPVDRHRLPHVHQQRRQEHPMSAAAQRDLSLPVDDLDRPQDPELHPTAPG